MPRSHARDIELASGSGKLRAANGTEIAIEGRVTLPVVVNRVRSSANFLVSPNVDEVILGRDWLACNSVKWDFARNNIRVNGKLIHLTDTRHDTPRIGTVRLHSDADSLSRREPDLEEPTDHLGVATVQTAAPAVEPGPDTADTAPIDWPALQLQDPQLAFVHHRVQSGLPAPTPEELSPQSEEVKILCRQFSSLTLSSDGTLCRKYLNNRTGQHYLQKIPPPSLRSLSLIHISEPTRPY